VVAINRPAVVLKQNSRVTTEAIHYTIPTRKGSVEFSLLLGDLTKVKMDAIVCPSNSGYELAFSGVQDAIERRAGMTVFDEATSYARSYGSGNGVPLSHSVSTTAGNLKQLKGIIHVNNVEMATDTPLDVKFIKACVESVLSTATQKGFESVAFPALGTGIWGMSLSDALKGTIAGIKGYFDTAIKEPSVKKVGFVIYARPSVENANELLEALSDVLRT
jgi:O-acetyl-ADP-ribose deacetylase (regulator of RNase III)